MSAKILLEYADFLSIAVTAAILVVMHHRRVLREFKALGLYLSAVLMLETIQVSLLYFRRDIGLDVKRAWAILFYSTQVINTLEVVLIIAVIYTVFKVAMRPFKGLLRMGTLVFRWVAGVSLLLALVMALSPHVFGSSGAFDATFQVVIGRLQEGANVLVLCLLLFVCLSCKPLGLSFRSNAFGISLGLGIISTTDLVQAAYFWTGQAQSVYSPIYLFSTIGYLAAFAVWGVYFTMPEPARKLIVLPTKSPFHEWNRISEALGGSAGNVALNFTASMISPAETQMFTAMGKGSRERAVLAAAKVESEMNSLVAS